MTKKLLWCPCDKFTGNLTATASGKHNGKKADCDSKMRSEASPFYQLFFLCHANTSNSKERSAGEQNWKRRAKAYAKCSHNPQYKESHREYKPFLFCLFTPSLQTSDAHNKHEYHCKRHQCPYIKICIDRRRFTHKLRQKRHRHSYKDNSRSKHHQKRPEKQEKLAAIVVRIHFALWKKARTYNHQDESRQQHGSVRDRKHETYSCPTEGMDRKISENTASSKKRSVNNQCIRKYYRQMHHRNNCRPDFCCT